MSKFKVGDRVKRVVDGFPEILIGTEWIVCEVVEDGNTIAVEGLPYYWSSDNFKLVNEQDVKTYNPLVAQEGGGHYKDKGIQPLEYTMKNNLSFCEGNVVKYISRYKSKNGVEDLAKVIHYALLASYEEYGEQGSTELKEKVLKLLGETNYAN